ncbi:MAG: glutamate synthase large subunit [Verrucomicrobiota bacterium]
MGEKASHLAPDVMQCFMDLSGIAPEKRELELYLTRRSIEKEIARLHPSIFFHISSMSSRTIVYKGLMLGNQLTGFYPELTHNGMQSAIAVVHQRYSTNTFPSWELAQPFRYLAHNGEINTLRGNLNLMNARELKMRSERLKVKEVAPLFDADSSDSANLDIALELLTQGGRDMAHAMMMLIPQAWGVKYPIGPDLRGFFEYHAGLMEPWDGPAAVSFTNGKQVGAMLDRNGLRPARYAVTKNNQVVLASETGVLKLPCADIVESGALRPGQIMLVDTETGRLLKNKEIKSTYCRKEPYRRWVEENKIVLHGLFNDMAPVQPDSESLLDRQLTFGYTREDVEMIIRPMAESAHEPVGSMGSDIPLAVLDESPQLLYSYFKQLFAQVTNPAIDPIREELVMSLMTFMGNPSNILVDTPHNSRLIKLPHPILSNEDMERLRHINIEGFQSLTIPMQFPIKDSPEVFEEALENLCDKAQEAAESGISLIILSDRELTAGNAPLPALLTVSAVNQRLQKKGTRTSTSLIIETGEAREVHHIALLLGYGATAVNPYLAFETIAELTKEGVLKLESTRALENYVSALCKGLLKIMSRMGISTLRSYRSGQVFEAIGIGPETIRRFFKGTVSRIGGIELADIHQEVISRITMARQNAGNRILPPGGKYRFRKNGTRHLWNPATISKLQIAARTCDYSVYKEYAELINNQQSGPCTLRGILSFKETKSIPLDQVEPAENIIKRFVTSAMSFGSISKEAHETLAIAMNRLGAMSNSGEGGEDPERYKPMPNGDSRCSKVKQVASGRFGVTTEYLRNAEELQIKIAQGAKPGEGGQLPGHKVNAIIARVRHSTPGVTLISPPPHHDIYSIEDIKQLIFDLKNVNPRARISVKLVSEQGVGTVAAGVAKAKADMILVSGGDSGTGAAPLSSISYAGAPWELGLSETNEVLCVNGLRNRVRLQTDGQLKTGRDVIIAAMLGADEFGFGSAPLITCGCVMLRNCHKNTCSTGVATQDPRLRERFCGKPEYVMNFFKMLAEEVREYLAALGCRTIGEITGRSDLLQVDSGVSSHKAKTLNLSKILPPNPSKVSHLERIVQDHEIHDVLDHRLIQEAAPSLEKRTPVKLEHHIRNTDRTTGAMLSGEVVDRYGAQGLPEDTIHCRFNGAAGQSFGAFGTAGITLELIGESNDYLGKGLSGAKIIVRPSKDSEFNPSENVICGNVLLYGATSGQVYINGKAGERFGVRNSGACAVVEGVGDHGCEYMTGGRIVVLGTVGVNFAAGMSGGLAYIYDPERQFDRHCNLEMVDLEFLDQEDDIAEVRSLIENHAQFTGSPKAASILANWERSVSCFIKVFPMEYRRALGQMSRDDEAVKRMEKVTE